MDLRNIHSLYPCHTLEDFPIHLEGSEASELLATWTTPWHPYLLNTFKKLPVWSSADSPPDPAELQNSLLLVPSASLDQLPSEWLEAAQNKKNCFTKIPSRVQLLEQLLAHFQLTAPAHLPAPTDQFAEPDNWVARFWALGYTYLQIEILSRQFRYGETIEVEAFEETVLTAAQQVLDQQFEEAETSLTDAFDQLSLIRTMFYPVDYYLIDITLASRATWGAALKQDLASGTANNLLLTGNQLEEIATSAPETLTSIRTALTEEKLTVLGGRDTLTLKTDPTPESLLASFLAGEKLYQTYLGKPPKVYGQFDSNFSPIYPQLLETLGYAGVLHTSFDGHLLPAAQQCKTEWVGLNGASVEALAKAPLDVASCHTMLALAQSISDAMDKDHVATLLLAGWSGHRSPYHNDLRVAARYGPVLGQFITLEEYFDQTEPVDHWKPLEEGEYSTPYKAFNKVDSPAHANLQTKYSDQVNTHHQLLLAGLAEMVKKPNGSPNDTPNSSPNADQKNAPQDHTLPSSASTTTPPTAPLVDSLQTLALCCSKPSEESLNNTPNASITAVSNTALNPASTASPTAATPLTFSANGWNFSQTFITSQKEKLLLAQPPGLGFSWTQTVSSQAPVPIADETILRNEHLEVTLDPTTGGVKLFKLFSERNNRVSQQLAFRMESLTNKQLPQYATTVGTELSITQNNNTFGEITTSGKLLDPVSLTPLAEFSQQFRLYRDEHLIRLQIEITPYRIPNASAWKSYYCSRLAWPSEPSSLACGRYGLRTPTEAKRIESGEWLDFAFKKRSFQLFPQGLTYHQLVAGKKLDTLLPIQPTKGTASRFHLAFGLDESYPTQKALALSTSPASLTISDRTPSLPTGWFLHLSSKNLVITHLSRNNRDEDPRWITLRILETATRETTATLSAYLPILEASLTDFSGHSLRQLDIQAGRAIVPIAPSEWVQVKLRYS